MIRQMFIADSGTVAFLLFGVFFLLVSGILWTQKLRTHLLRTQSSNVLHLKPRVSQNIATHASPTARDFFLELITTNLVSSPSIFFFPNLSLVFPVLALANTGSCVGVGPRNKLGHPARRSRWLIQVPTLSARGI